MARGTDDAPVAGASGKGAAPAGRETTARSCDAHVAAGGTGVELLAPAGGRDAFLAALAAGADAVYVGHGSDFNARRSADNLTDDDLAELAALAHLAGSRVYVTMNVLVKDKEMPAALAQARRAWELGADALIVQDWGLLAELRRRWPKMECHASTQMAIMDARGCRFARARGVSRVTLARELSLAEIAACAADGTELEVFAHGALCFCYSGLCLMSSLGGVRSANRGLCAQPCRLPYELVDAAGARVAAPGHDRPLCPRDLRTVDLVGELVRAGARSLKVEGRMKAPEYVHAVVSAYRDAVDELGLALRPVASSDAPLGADGRARLLARAFNRDFTDAYLHGTSGNDLMSYERSNNRGELVGTVVGGRELGARRVRRGGADGGRERLRTTRLAEVDLALERDVGRGDLLELRPLADPSQFVTATAQADVAAGGRLTVRAPRTVPPGSTVRVIRSQAALDAVRRVSASCPRKRPVDVRVTARVGQPLEVALSCADGSAQARATGTRVEEARTRAVTAAELAEHAARLGTTPFAAASVKVDLDAGVGLAFSELHGVRARAAARLAQRLLAPYEGRGDLVGAPVAADLAAHLRHERAHDAVTRVPNAGRTELCVLAPNAAVARRAVAAGATRLYADADAYAEVVAAAAGVPVVPWLDEVCREADHARLDALVTPGESVAVGNVSELALACERGAAAELRATIPVHNASALLAFEQLGARGVWLSGELSLAELSALAKVARVPVGLVVFGRERAMTSEHCILQACGDCAHACAGCARRRKRHFLVGGKGERLPVTSDAHGRSRVWAAQPLDAIPQVGELLAAGVRRLLVDATLLGANEAAAAVTRLAAAVRAAETGGRPCLREAGATAGHLFAEVL